MKNSKSSSGKVSIIIINFRSDKYLEKCIASLYNFEEREKFEIIIINNEKEKEGLIRQKYPSARCIDPGENLGFAKSANLGAREAEGEFLFFLNPDTELREKVLDKLTGEFAAEGELAVAGPRLVSREGQTQEWAAGRSLNPGRLVAQNLGFGKTDKSFAKRKTAVDWVSGAAMFFRKKDFIAAGGFDENFFMYFEDMDICRRLKDKGKKIYFFPEIGVRHLGSGSEIKERERKKNYFASQDHYLEKHFGKKTASLMKILRKIFKNKC